MATHWGNEGKVKVGANTVAEIINFKFDQQVQPIDDTAMGDAWKTHIAGSGIKSWSGSMDCHWDELDATGQEALPVGTSVTLNLYVEGDQTGDKYYTGTATITSVGIDVPMDSGTIRRNIEFMGSGPLTLATAP